MSIFKCIVLGYSQIEKGDDVTKLKSGLKRQGVFMSTWGWHQTPNKILSHKDFIKFCQEKWGFSLKTAHLSLKLRETFMQH